MIIAAGFVCFAFKAAISASFEAMRSFGHRILAR
jgi:hypothetical protein